MKLSLGDDAKRQAIQKGRKFLDVNPWKNTRSRFMVSIPVLVLYNKSISEKILVNFRPIWWCHMLVAWVKLFPLRLFVWCCCWKYKDWLLEIQEYNSLLSNDWLICSTTMCCRCSISVRDPFGASGDLAPLAHLCLPLIGEGEVVFWREKTSIKKMSWRNLTGSRLNCKAKKVWRCWMEHNSCHYGVYCLLRSYQLVSLSQILSGDFSGRLWRKTWAIW